MTFGLAGGGNVKSWKTLRVQRSGLNWMGDNKHKYYICDLHKQNGFTLFGGYGGGGVNQKNQKKSYF